MKLIKTYESFNSSDIKSICDEYSIENYIINEDDSIDVEGDVILSYVELTDIPLKFRNVSGDFDCSWGKLTSLEGCPINVGGHFFCDYNKLVNLVGGPQTVGGDYRCDSNQLTSLKGSPETVGCHFICSDNELTNLERCTKNIGGDIELDNNNIRDLDGLENMKFIRLFISDNPVEVIWELIGDKKHLEFFNDCDIIRDDIIIRDRLNFFLEEIGKEPVTEVKGYKII